MASESNNSYNDEASAADLDAVPTEAADGQIGKRLFVFCDGTGKTSKTGSQLPTNVTRLAKAVNQADHQGELAVGTVHCRTF
jgi:uncharacterized protein (DUF2235 family)